MTQLELLEYAVNNAGKWALDKVQLEDSVNNYGVKKTTVRAYRHILLTKQSLSQLSRGSLVNELDNKYLSYANNINAFAFYSQHIDRLSDKILDLKIRILDLSEYIEASYELNRIEISTLLDAFNNVNEEAQPDQSKDFTSWYSESKYFYESFSSITRNYQSSANHPNQVSRLLKSMQYVAYQLDEPHNALVDFLKHTYKAYQGATEMVSTSKPVEKETNTSKNTELGASNIEIENAGIALAFAFRIDLLQEKRSKKDVLNFSLKYTNRSGNDAYQMIKDYETKNLRRKATKHKPEGKAPKLSLKHYDQAIYLLELDGDILHANKLRKEKEEILGP